jgi:hypothetical protein
MVLIEQTQNINLVNLMKWLSTGRFLPEHWHRFGLPKLENEIRSDFLKIRDELYFIEQRLSWDDFRKLYENHIWGFILLWQNWRERAIKAGVEKNSWEKWKKQNKDLYNEWEDGIIFWSNETLRQINLIDKKISTKKPDLAIPENPDTENWPPKGYTKPKDLSGKYNLPPTTVRYWKDQAESSNELLDDEIIHGPKNQIAYKDSWLKEQLKKYPRRS